MPKNAIKFIREVEKEAVHKVSLAENDIKDVVKKAEEEASRRRDSEVFKLEKELDELEKSEKERAGKEAEDIRAKGEEELADIRRRFEENREKALRRALSEMLEGD